MGVNVDAFLLFFKVMVSCYQFDISLCALHVHAHNEVFNTTSDNRKCMILSHFVFCFLFLMFVMES